MARQIIKQPNGKYCIFSTIVDNVTHYNLERDDIISLWTEEQKKLIEEDVDRIITGLKNGDKPYYNNTLSFDKMLSNITEIHGEKEYDGVMKLLM